MNVSKNCVKNNVCALPITKYFDGVTFEVTYDRLIYYTHSHRKQSLQKYNKRP
jgi:hypothetical protein